MEAQPTAEPVPVQPASSAAPLPFADAVAVCRVGDVPDNEGLRVGLPNPLAVFRIGDEYFALDDTCTHQDASLADGWVEDCTVECPLHASRFDLRTGAVSGPPAKVGVRAYAVAVVDGTVWVQTSQAPTSGEGMSG